MVNEVIRTHISVLQKRGLAKDFIVADARNVKLRFDVEADRDRVLVAMKRACYALRRSVARLSANSGG